MVIAVACEDRLPRIAVRQIRGCPDPARWTVTSE